MIKEKKLFNQRCLEASERKVGALENEYSRYQFTYDHSSVKGVWLHWFAKKFIIKSLFFIHEQVQKRYDKNCYTFQDPRLYYIQQFTREYFAENMEERKCKILNAAIDIALFILKEDIFYRVRFIDMIMKFIDTYRVVRWDTNTKVIGTTGEPLFGLDEPEQENLKLWKGK